MSDEFAEGFALMFPLTKLFTLIPPVLAQVDFLSANTLVLGMGFVVLLVLVALLVRVMLIKQPAEPIPVSPPPVAEKQEEVRLYGELVVMDGMSGTKRILINKDEFSIGRGLEFNDYELNLPGISRQHIVLQLGQTDKRMYITDLESSNGTLLNGKKLNANEPHALHNGDEITLSQVNLRWKALFGLDSQDDSTVHSVEGRTKQLKVVEKDKPEESW
jgi:Na+-transporting methylmalonyl-CoA/oxaloacetate decarboxylase gamma subunit